MIEISLFENIKKYNKRILLVTKYWDTNTTHTILKKAQEKYPKEFYALWENRIDTIKEKNLPRELVHFIGNIQSRKIPEIIRYCSVIHSLESISHAEKIEKQSLPTQAFVQVRLDDSKEIGISPDELWDFLESCKTMKYLSIIWISGMWSGMFEEAQKRQEFQTLLSLRNKYIPDGIISAGTSRDYHIALEEWIDIVRVWMWAVQQ